MTQLHEHPFRNENFRFQIPLNIQLNWWTVALAPLHHIPTGTAEKWGMGAIESTQAPNQVLANTQLVLFCWQISAAVADRLLHRCPSVLLWMCLRVEIQSLESCCDKRQPKPEEQVLAVVALV